MRVLTIVGTRPQFIKAAVVSGALKAHGFKETLLDTGQHYDWTMNAVFFGELNVPKPDIELRVGSARHGVQTARMLEGIEESIIATKPDWVLVYGDTNSTLAGALAGAKLHTPVGHIEAGLRSFNREMPEEVNRVIADHLSRLCFAPTEVAVANLRAEGIAPDSVLLAGDVMLDVSVQFRTSAERRSRVLDDHELDPGCYVLSTIHRAENTDDPNRLRVILEGLSKVALTVPVVMPLHPRTGSRLSRDPSLLAAADGIRLLPPVGYLDMVMLEASAAAIATDSGGVQKEAFFYRVPCATLRTETEWTELVSMGWNRLVSLESSESIANGVLACLGTRGIEASPYGDGHAAQTIVTTLAARSGGPMEVEYPSMERP